MDLVIVVTLFATITSIASQSSPGNEERIVGGYPIEIEDAPYQASLLIQDENGTSLCGAVLISEMFVLTAAHCCDSPSALYVVGVGSTNIFKGDNLAVDDVFVHPFYYGHDYDIAIIRLAKAVNFTSKIQPAKLPKEDDVARPGDMTVVSGWGRTGENARDDVVGLRATLLPIMDMKICRQLYAKFHYYAITSRMICAGYLEGGLDSCYGDSGGPMFRESDEIVIGLVSWGSGCARQLTPGFYTNIASVRKWIRGIAGV